MIRSSCLPAGLALVVLAVPGQAPAGGRAPPQPPAPSPGERSLELVNNDTVAITSVYAAKAGTQDWTDDLIGKQDAAVGRTVALRFKGAPDQCAYDLQLLMNDGKSVQKDAVDVCAGRAFQFAR